MPLPIFAVNERFYLLIYCFDYSIPEIIETCSHSIINRTRRTAARPIPEGMTIFCLFMDHGVNKIEVFRMISFL